MAAVFWIKRNDTAPAIASTLTDANGTVVDLTGATVKFLMYDASMTQVVSSAATIVSAAGGQVKYLWAAADTETAGTYSAEWEATYSDATIQTFPNPGYIKVKIAADLG